MTRTMFPASEIDWEEDSGEISFIEYKKRQETRERINKDFFKVESLCPKDWALLFIHANKGEILKVPLFKHLFIFSERTGLGEISFDWYPGDFGPHSRYVENALEKLTDEKTVEMEIGKTSNERIYKKYIIQDTKKGEALWSLLPENFQFVISEVVDELNELDIESLLHYTYAAYPEYATRSKFQE